MQKVIESDSYNGFVLLLEEALRDGCMIVPGTMVQWHINNHSDVYGYNNMEDRFLAIVEDDQ